MSPSIDEIISPAFYDIHDALKAHECSEFILKGGRGSTKSSFISIQCIMSLLRNPKIHAVVFRKVGNTIRTTTYPQYYWALDVLGILDKCKCTVNPPCITYLKTGQRIMFFGTDDPGKLKSIKVPFGYIGFAHFEELDQYAGEEEIRSIEQSVLRGGELAIEFKSFNPPRTRDNWANRYCLIDKPGQVIHHSTYLTTPPEWLGARFIDDAEFLKQSNPKAYRHEYLGEAVGSGGQVFENARVETLPDELYKTADRFHCGCDFGFALDPDALVKCYFDKRERVLYVMDEYYGTHAPIDTLAEQMKKLCKNTPIVCDSASPRIINEVKRRNVVAVAARKGPDSVEHGIRWLQELKAIVIDKKRCPNTAREFVEYEYKRDRYGNLFSDFPDKDNHCIDAVRYAMEEISAERIATTMKKAYVWW
jgi:PBSX family phage terminase large subunit